MGAPPMSRAPVDAASLSRIFTSLVSIITFIGIFTVDEAGNVQSSTFSPSMCGRVPIPFQNVSRQTCLPHSQASLPLGIHHSYLSFGFCTQHDSLRAVFLQLTQPHSSTTSRCRPLSDPSCSSSRAVISRHNLHPLPRCVHRHLRAKGGRQRQRARTLLLL
jgi:hypothetical protein